MNWPSQGLRVISHHKERDNMPPRKKKAAAKSAAPKSSELSLIEDLAAILNRTGLTEIELDRGGARVRVSKATMAAPMQVSQVASPAHHAPAPAAAPQPAAPVAAKDSADALKSPMVGTCYLSPTPGAAPFVAVGATVKQGQTVLIIEAMKTMNQIAAIKSGTVTSIFVDNGQPVEFGEVLMVIE
jgi:acetyl-CoA carboxylase biotin carboxyl carrier protein